MIQDNKLNELPNNEYKYNKILSYFDLSLELLDWEKLNKKAIPVGAGTPYDYLSDYIQNIVY